MRFDPSKTNIMHSDYNGHSWWARHIVEELVLRYYSQSGTDKTRLEEHMLPRFKKTLEILGPEIEELHNKAFKLNVNIVENKEKDGI